MPLRIDPRLGWALITAAVVLPSVLFAVRRLRLEERPVRTWSGTIASGAPTELRISNLEARISNGSDVDADHAELIGELNRYWLAKLNELRIQKGLLPLRVHTRLVSTAGEWASEMASRREITHERLDGKTMHQWIDTKQLPFTKHDTDGGWKTNYFVENIARFYAEPTESDMRRALDEALKWFLDEGPGGDHYESIHHPDWNSVGLGFAFDPVEQKSRVYFAFHYGSLLSGDRE